MEQNVSTEVIRGYVAWFSDSKGFGFIKSAGRPDAYVHFVDIISDDKRKKLENNQVVEFEVTETPRGLAAKKVRIVG